MNKPNRKKRENSQTDIRQHISGYHTGCYNENCLPGMDLLPVIISVDGVQVMVVAEFYNKGDVKMFGNYHIQQGIYKFSLQEVIRKDFYQDGSTITFNGPPLNATLDIQASCTLYPQPH